MAAATCGSNGGGLASGEETPRRAAVRSVSRSFEPQHSRKCKKRESVASGADKLTVQEADDDDDDEALPRWPEENWR